MKPTDYIYAGGDKVRGFKRRRKSGLWLLSDNNTPGEAEEKGQDFVIKLLTVLVPLFSVILTFTMAVYNTTLNGALSTAQLNLNLSTLKIQNRAYLNNSLSLLSINTAPHSSKAYSIAIKIKNVGKTPATGIQTRVQWQEKLRTLEEVSHWVDLKGVDIGPGEEATNGFILRLSKDVDSSFPIIISGGHIYIDAFQDEQASFFCASIVNGVLTDCLNPTELVREFMKTANKST